MKAKRTTQIGAMILATLAATGCGKLEKAEKAIEKTEILEGKISNLESIINNKLPNGENLSPALTAEEASNLKRTSIENAQAIQALEGLDERQRELENEIQKIRRANEEQKEKIKEIL